MSSSDDIMELLAVGEKARTTASTGMNEVSSRSHSVLIIVVNQKLKDGSVRVGKVRPREQRGEHTDSGEGEQAGAASSVIVVFSCPLASASRSAVESGRFGW